MFTLYEKELKDVLETVWSWHGVISAIFFAMELCLYIYKYGLPLVLWVSIVMENDKLLLDKGLLPVDEQ
jgi:hypothetical protein